MNFKYVIIVMASVAFFSCSDGEDGMTGPIGPQGEQGIQGPQGPAGQDGADGIDGQEGTNGIDGQDGEDGNANVISSPWINVDFPSTSQSFVSFGVDDPIFNEFTVSSAAIYAYGRFVGGDGTINVNSIPYTRSNKSYFFRMLPNSNRILFIGNTVDNSNVVFDELERVRYVVIPFSVTGKSTVDFDKMTYEEVMDHLGLDY